MSGGSRIQQPRVERYIKLNSTPKNVRRQAASARARPDHGARITGDGGTNAPPGHRRARGSTAVYRAGDRHRRAHRHASDRPAPVRRRRAARFAVRRRRRGGINIPPDNEQRFVKDEVVLEFAGNFPPPGIAQLLGAAWAGCSSKRRTSR